MKEPILSLRDVRFSYPDTERNAIDSISFDIAPGTINAVLGPNGAGKSTLLYLLLGRFRPKQGKVLLRGKPVNGYSRRDLSRIIGLVPQREYVPFDYKIIEYILLGRTPHLGFLSVPRPEDIEVSYAALRELEIENLANRPVTMLSGGEHQLALIARTLAQAPEILLFDEPTSHLDIANKKRVLQIMRALANRNLTVIYTTHDPESAAAIADALLLMRGGRVLHYGALEDIFTTKNLSETYQTDLNVTEIEGQKLVLLNL